MLALGNQAKVNAPQNLRPNFDLATNLALADHSYAQVFGLEVGEVEGSENLRGLFARFRSVIVCQGISRQ